MAGGLKWAAGHHEAMLTELERMHTELAAMRQQQEEQKQLQLMPSILLAAVESIRVDSQDEAAYTQARLASLQSALWHHSGIAATSDPAYLVRRPLVQTALHQCAMLSAYTRYWREVSNAGVGLRRRQRHV